MNKMNGKTEVKEGLIPKMARKVGEKSVDAACSWWMCQPKVPAAMKRDEK